MVCDSLIIAPESAIFLDKLH